MNIDALFIEYAQHFFARHDPQAWEAIVQIEGRLNEKNIPRHMIGREKRVVAIEQYLTAKRIFDPVMDGLRSAVRYDRTYFDKIVASLLPLLEKLTSGKTAQLLAPNYTDLDDPRPIFDWLQVIRKRGIVYVGLDALSDARWRLPSATRCLPTWFRSLAISTNTALITACLDPPAPRTRCRSTCTPTSSTS